LPALQWCYFPTGSLRFEEALLFLKKKKQKDFFMLGHGRWNGQRPCFKVIKVFAPLFSKSGCVLFT
jgi:hypothetical protein